MNRFYEFSGLFSGLVPFVSKTRSRRGGKRGTHPRSYHGPEVWGQTRFDTVSCIQIGGLDFIHPYIRMPACPWKCRNPPEITKLGACVRVSGSLWQCPYEVAGAVPRLAAAPELKASAQGFWQALLGPSEGDRGLGRGGSQPPYTHPAGWPTVYPCIPSADMVAAPYARRLYERDTRCCAWTDGCPPRGRWGGRNPER